MNGPRLLNELAKLGRPRILVVGDVILDRYIWGNADRVSQEAPVVLLREETREERPGGAANVAQMVAALDAASTTLVGVVGQDSDADRLRSLLADRGVEARLVCDPSRPTTVKERFIGKAHARHPHQMLRVDRETTAPIAGQTEQAVRKFVQEEAVHCDAILISDYRKGVCTEGVLSTAIRTARRRNIPVLVDPGRGVTIAAYRSATLVKPNRSEAASVLGRPLNSIEEACRGAEELLRAHDLDYVVITLDREGLVLAERTGSTRHFPTQARTVYDITGAGDMVLAALGVCLGGGLTAEVAVQIANVAAGLEVEHVGVVPIPRTQIADAIRRRAVQRPHKVVELEELLREGSAAARTWRAHRVHERLL